MKKHVGKALMKRKKHFTSLNSYAIGTDKDEIHVNDGWICFADVNRAINNLRGNVSHFYLATAHKMDKPYFKEYLKFILTESIFKDCYLTKRVCDATRYGVSLDVTKPANQLQAGLIAIRRGYEFPGKTETWYDFVKAGINPNIALILSYFVIKTEENSSYSFNPHGWTSNHEVFGDLASFEHSLEMLNKPLKSLSPPISKSKDFRMNVFDTTCHAETGKKLDWNVVKDAGFGIKTLLFDGTVEKLKKIQKEYNVS